MGRDRSDYELLFDHCVSELERGRERRASLQLLCMAVIETLPSVRWIGFYLTVPGEDFLVLGPFEGPPSGRVRLEISEDPNGRVHLSHADEYSGDDSPVNGEVALPVRRGDSADAPLGRLVVTMTRELSGAEEEALYRFLSRLADVSAPYMIEIPAE